VPGGENHDQDVQQRSLPETTRGKPAARTASKGQIQGRGAQNGAPEKRRKRDSKSRRRPLKRQRYLQMGKEGDHKGIPHNTKKGSQKCGSQGSASAAGEVKFWGGAIKCMHGDKSRRKLRKTIYESQRVRTHARSRCKVGNEKSLSRERHFKSPWGFRI